MDKKKIEQGKKMIENARSAIRLNKNTKNRVEIIDKAMRELYNFFLHGLKKSLMIQIIGFWK